MIKRIPPREFNFVAKRFREFFLARQMVECNVQHHRTILSACESPENVLAFVARGRTLPTRQTSQMDLELEIMNDPSLAGLFCFTMSTRQEQHPIPNRHEDAFIMLEAEFHGGMTVLELLLRDLLEHFGFGPGISFPSGDYLDVAKRYGVKEIDHEIETRIGEDFGPIFFLKNFPEYTSPFWNMRRDGNTARKIDVLIHGIETIGSAERSSDAHQMRERFMTISGGGYAEKLYEFGKSEVLQELDEFLNLPFIERSGFGMGFNRFLRGLKLSNLIPVEELEQVGAVAVS